MKRGKRVLTRASCVSLSFNKFMEYVAAILFGALLFAAFPALAQSPDSTGSPKPGVADAGTAGKPAPGKKKSKKVWTNDELPKTGDGVSVVGDPSAQNGEPQKTPASADPKDNPRQHQINQYKTQLSKLQSQIDALDKRIDQLKNFKGENTSPAGGININQGYDMVPIPEQIKELEEKKKQLRARMDDLETEAHKNGITSDDLR